MKELALTIGNWTIKPPAGVPDGKPGMSEVIIKSGINILLVVAVLLALLFLVWGGFDYITSEGKKDKIERAKKKLTFAVIGLAVVFLAFAIISIIGQVFNTKFY